MKYFTARRGGLVILCRKLLSAALASLISFGVAAAGYDVELAASYAKLFEPAIGARTGKALHLIKPDQLVKELQAGKQIVALDVRTPNEFGVFGLTVPGSIEMPINEVFLPENLERIPQDKTVVVVCKAGTRAAAVGTALRHVGFENVYVLKGGLMALSKYLDPKTANPPMPELSAR
jgi:rhodanese-related sulfurtransferase